MSTTRFASTLAAAALLLAACGTPATSPEVTDDAPLTTIMPDLAVEAGTAGTERYVPVLHRLLGHAVHHVARAHGKEAAEKILTEVKQVQGEIKAALERGDEEAARRGMMRLDHLAAMVTVRVFGPPVVGHVLQHGSQAFRALLQKIQAAEAAGHDVEGARKAAAVVAQHLGAARAAAEKGEPVAALVHGARALDLLARLHAGR